MFLKIRFVENWTTVYNSQPTSCATPREITASCGISIRFLYDDTESVKKILNENSVEYKGIYKIKRLENGTKEVENIG